MGWGNGNKRINIKDMRPTIFVTISACEVSARQIADVVNAMKVATSSGTIERATIRLAVGDDSKWSGTLVHVEGGKRLHFTRTKDYFCPLIREQIHRLINANAEYAGRG